jgi:hypothetical protein
MAINGPVWPVCAGASTIDDPTDRRGSRSNEWTSELQQTSYQSRTEEEAAGIEKVKQQDHPRSEDASKNIFYPKVAANPSRNLMLVHTA